MPNRNSILTSVLCLVLALCSIFLYYVWGDQEPLGIDPPRIDPIIAISLGNTNSRVAFLDNGTTHFIPNAQGHNATPNYFAFNQSNYLMGEDAKVQTDIEFMGESPVISGFTRYLGQNFTSMQSETGVGNQYLVDRDGVPKYRIQPPFGEVVEYSPTDLTGFLLLSLRQDAERYLGRKVEHAVVVVENGFSDDLRRDLRDAGKLAGLDVVRIVQRSPMVAYAHDIAERKKEIITLVYHLGSSFAEASVVAIEEGVFEILSQSRDTHESPTAHSINQKVVQFIVDALDPFYALDPVEEGLKSIELKSEAERVQRILSSKNEVEIQDRGKSINLSRAKFEELFDTDLKRTLVHVDKAIAEAKVTVPEIKAVLLSGGSANVPKIKDMLGERLGKPVLDGKDFNPEEAAVVGAAKVANFIMHDPPNQGCPIMDISQRNLGVETIEGFIERMVWVGTTLPTKKSAVFTTVIDNQKKAVINVFEWSRPFTKYGNLSATLTLNDLPPAPAGKVEIEIIFEIDVDEILTVTALHQQTGRSETISVNWPPSTQEQRWHLQEEDDKYREEDAAAGERIRRLVAEGKLVGKDGDIRHLYLEVWRDHEEL